VLEPAVEGASVAVLVEKDEMLKAGNEVTSFSVATVLETRLMVELLAIVGASVKISVSVLLEGGVKIELLWVRLAPDRVFSVELTLKDGDSIVELSPELN
jgi:hypothetical protein